MMDWGYGVWHGWWGGLWMLLLWVAILLLVVWAVRTGAPGGSDPRASARAILAERLARGEITVEEYRRLLQELR